MTVVLAKRFGNIIELVSDTMISDSDRGRENAIPGRLKIICLAPDLTVAYAGHSDPALHTIKQLFGAGITQSPEVLEALRRSSDSSDHTVEFLVASHQPNADLRKVWMGRISNSLDEAALGNPTIRNAVYDGFTPTGNADKDGGAFHLAFLVAFTSERVSLGAGVGGLPLALRASPDGHKYRFSSFHLNRKPIEFLPGVVQHQNPTDMQTGDWTFHFNILRTELSGVAVVAAQIQQARRAYIYCPLLDDDPESVVLLEPDIDWTEHQVRMIDRTKAALEIAVQRMVARCSLGPLRGGETTARGQ